MGLFTPILFIFMLLVLIIPHEWGHMMMAKKCGVKVLEFSVGMGPLLYKKKKGETEYSVRLFPFGGFCRIEGEDEAVDSPTSYSTKSTGQKLAILLAGVGMNMVIAIVAIIISIAITGVVTNTVGEIMPGRPAETVLHTEDTIISINGEETKSWNNVADAINAHEKGDDPLHITYIRDGKTMTADILPKYDKELEDYAIGIKSQQTRNVWTCAKYVPVGLWDLTKAMLLGFKMIFTGEVGAADIAGPVGLVKYVDEAAGYGPASYLILLALVSLNLVLFNVLPIPGLDGGKILFTILNRITGDKITSEMEYKITAVSMIFIWVLFCGVMINDMLNLMNYW